MGGGIQAATNDGELIMFDPDGTSLAMFFCDNVVGPIPSHDNGPDGDRS